MNCAISRGVLQRLETAAGEAFPLEICGLLLGMPGSIKRFIPIANVASDPRTAFELDPAAHLRAARTARGAGLCVLGHYHSHPGGDASPSLADAERADEQGILWLILGRNGARLWISRSGGGVLGRFDPVRLDIAGALQPADPDANRVPQRGRCFREGR